MGRYLGNLLVVALNVVYLVVAVWIIWGSKTGLWVAAISARDPLHDVQFRRNAQHHRLYRCAVGEFGRGHHGDRGTHDPEPDSGAEHHGDEVVEFEWSRNLWNGVYYILPKVYGLGRMTQMTVSGQGVDSGCRYGVRRCSARWCWATPCGSSVEGIINAESDGCRDVAVCGAARVPFYQADLSCGSIRHWPRWCRATSTILIGVRIESLKDSYLWRKYIENAEIPGLANFVKISGLDPGRTYMKRCSLPTARTRC